MKYNKITVKLSHSILSTWAAHRYEDAVSYYLGRDVPPTPQMELGRLKHEQWEAHIRKHNTIPDEVGGGELTEPIVETKYEKLIPLGDKYQILLRGVPDLLDLPICYEWKCGMSEPSSYIDSMQLPYYKLLVPEIEVGIYRCFNPYTNKYKTGIRYLTNDDIELALEHIITFGSEMIDYLTSQKLLVDYKPEIYARE